MHSNRMNKAQWLEWLGAFFARIAMSVRFRSGPIHITEEWVSGRNRQPWELVMPLGTRLTVKPVCIQEFESPLLRQFVKDRL
jgi:hypothetical protein